MALLLAAIAATCPRCDCPMNKGPPVGAALRSDSPWASSRRVSNHGFDGVFVARRNLRLDGVKYELTAICIKGDYQANVALSTQRRRQFGDDIPASHWLDWAVTAQYTSSSAMPRSQVPVDSLRPFSYVRSRRCNSAWWASICAAMPLSSPTIANRSGMFHGGRRRLNKTTLHRTRRRGGRLTTHNVQSTIGRSL